MGAGTNVVASMNEDNNDSYVHICNSDDMNNLGDENMAITLPIPPKKKQKRDIKYGRAPKALVEAVRKQLHVLVESDKLEDDLGTLSRFANQADDMLMMLRAPEAVMRSDHDITVPGIFGQSNNAETYGAQIFRQLIPALSGWQKAQQETPEAMVRSIEMARAAGMVDVAAALETKLLGHPLDGERPIAFRRADAVLPAPTIEQYLKDVDVEAKKPKNKGKTKRKVANGVLAHINTSSADGGPL
jgi:hypothetical protein